MIFTYELARRLAERQLPVVANVLDPGIVDTELQRYLPTPAPTAGDALRQVAEAGRGDLGDVGLGKDEDLGWLLGGWEEGEEERGRFQMDG